ncbi:MFS transporter [Aquincola tertiaricarbonis]|uniref:MFS transporter n=1 Tax=Aquincola tertiaricarbonis TaxID=391953 RepID=UPI000614BBB8|nr:MFS transporter [Aquincola tertiaricarbonis]
MERIWVAALLAGNFVVATCAVMLMALIPALADALQVDAAAVGQLVTLSGAVMCVVAPLAPWLGRRIGQRRLLVAALVMQGLGLLWSASQSSLPALMASRALQVVGPAVFTAQAAAWVALQVPAERLGSTTARIYLGWPLALVLGMPAAAWFGGTWGAHAVFAALGLASLLVAAGVGWVLPVASAAQTRRSAGPADAAVSGAGWCLWTTAFASAAQLMLLTYFASFCREVLQAGPAAVALALGALGLLGTLGVGCVGRLVDRLGAARAVMGCLVLMAASMLAWPMARNLPLAVLVLTPWALAAFALNAAQQARLLALDPTRGPRHVGLNTAFVYLGQGMGAAVGGAWVLRFGYAGLGLGALVLLAAAAACSWRSGRLQRPARCKAA